MAKFLRSCGVFYSFATVCWHRNAWVVGPSCVCPTRGSKPTWADKASVWRSFWRSVRQLRWRKSIQYCISWSQYNGHRIVRLWWSRVRGAMYGRCLMGKLTCAILLITKLVAVPEKKERKTTWMLPPVYIIAAFLRWWKSICIPEMGVTRIRGPLKTTASFQRWTPQMGVDKPAGTYLAQGKPLGSHMVGWQFPVHLDIPTIIEWTKGGRVGRTKNQVLGRSPIWVLFWP